MDKNATIFVAGHRGLAGSAILRKLTREGYGKVVTRTREELDLLDPAAVKDFFTRHPIQFVFLAAAKVGGIYANATQQVEFLYQNTVLAMNVIRAAAQHGVEKLLFLGSSCIYPKFASQPIGEDSLLTGPLEPTNEGYAIAKIAGLKMCEFYNRQQGKRFISAMPTNLYGPEDRFDPLDSHVIPGLMRRFHEARISGAGEVTVWGTGRPRREFLHADDLADAVYLLMQKYEDPHTINVGTGTDLSIDELAGLMKEITGFEGAIRFDPSKPDGTPRKVLDVSRISAMGWKASRDLASGLRETYQWALQNGVFQPIPASETVTYSARRSGKV